MKVCILTVGNEILSGRTLDYNSHWIAKRLTGLGSDVLRVMVVKDEVKEIVEAIKYLLNIGCDLVVTTGGLGPTPGDVTLEAVSKVAGVDLKINGEALEMVVEKYRYLYVRGMVSSPDVKSERLKMAKLPLGAKPIYNPVGVAPGALLKVNGKWILSLPGVPSEMMATLETFIHEHQIETPTETFSLTKELTINVGDESFLSRIAKEVMDEVGNIKVKPYPVGFGKKAKINLAITYTGTDPEEANKAIVKAEKRVFEKIREAAKNDG